MILSGAVYGDLRDIAALQIGQQLNKRDSLDQVFARNRSARDGVRYESDTDTYVRFDRGQNGINKTLRTQDAHAHREWPSSSDRLLCWCSICTRIRLLPSWTVDATEVDTLIADTRKDRAGECVEDGEDNHR